MQPETVFFVDDNPTDRHLAQAILQKAGFGVRSFASAEEFLDHYAGEAGCLVLDVCMPGMNGPELQEKLAERGQEIPVVFLSGQADLATISRVFRRGAIDYLAKPYSHESLASSVEHALKHDRERRLEQDHKNSQLARLSRLTPREREVMTHLVRSRTAKEIGADLGLSPKTIQVHRAHILEKTEARSVIELTRLAIAAGVESVEVGARLAS